MSPTRNTEPRETCERCATAADTGEARVTICLTVSELLEAACGVADPLRERFLRAAALIDDEQVRWTREDLYGVR